MRKIVVSAIGIGLGAFFVWLLVRDIDWPEVGAAIRGIDWLWFVAAQVPIFLSFFSRVQRWTYIVRATDPVSFRYLLSATQIGFLANFLLLARVGELIRALVLTRLTRIRFSQSLAFVALDRVTDLLGMMVVMGVAILAFHPSGGVSISPDTFGTEEIPVTVEEIRLGALAIGMLIVAVISVLAFLYFRRDACLALTEAILGRVSRQLADVAERILGRFADGLAVFRSPVDMAKSIFWSLITWALFLVAITVVLEAFGIAYPWYTPFVIQALLAVVLILPNPPGFVGLFHLPVVLGLVFTMPEMDPNEAKAFAIVYYFVQWPAVLLLGFGCLLGERMNLLQLQSEGAELAHEEDAASHGG